MKREGTGLLILSGLWIALVVGYFIWGAITFSGLFRWLAELQIAWFGGYYERATAILPALIICGPAIYYLRIRAAVSQAEAEAELGPAVAEGRLIRRNVWGSVIFGVIACLIGAGAFLLSLGVPDGTEPATPFDIATLGSGPAPQGRVTIRGEVDEETGISIVETRGVSSRNTVFAALRPEGGAGKDAPFNLFIQRNAGSGTQPATTQMFLPEQSGYLIENGLPDAALREYATLGIHPASPHWLLRTGDAGGRDIYYIVAAVAGFLGIVCLLVAAIMAFQGRALLRRA